MQTYNTKVNQEEGSGFSSHPPVQPVNGWRVLRWTADHSCLTPWVGIVGAPFYPQNPAAGCASPRLELLYLLPKCDNDHEHEAVAGNKRHILEIKSNPCSAQGNDAEPEKPPENHRLSLYFLSVPLQLWDSALSNRFRIMLNCVSASSLQIWMFFCTRVWVKVAGGFLLSYLLAILLAPPGSLRWQSHKPH